MANRINPKPVIFRLPFSDIVFGSAPTRNWGPSFGKITSENGIRIWFPIRNGRQQAWQQAENSSINSSIVQDTRHASDVSLCRASNSYHRRTRAAADVPLRTGAHLGPHHEATGSDCDGDDYERFAIVLAVAIAAFAKHKTHNAHKLLVKSCLVKDKDSRRLRHVVVDVRDRLEQGGRQSSSREPHTA